ncbi:MAG: rod shape-determining protein MreC [Deltaproteobacteria bacterium]|nr:rod shape-determining protein MreC [Deltaproteobacteria bacterium]
MRLRNRGKFGFWVIATTLLVVVFLAAVLAPINKKEGLFSFILNEAAFPCKRGVQSVFEATNNVWERYIFLVGLTAENERLQRENSEFKNQIVLAREKEKELQRLQRLLALKELRGREYTGARVIARTITPTARTITIDKGIKAGVDNGMPVISVEGLVGRVIETSWHSSQVLLITDFRSNVDVVLQDSRTTGVVQGISPQKCRIKYVSLEDSVIEGELVLSSGLDRVFPKGLVLGSVATVERQDSALSLRVVLRPAVDFSKLEEIIVLTGE